jgi:hypothetical protein
MLINDTRQYQLAAMTSMYIAVKLYEPLSMDAALLAEISAGCYTPQEILDMEKCILEALEWRMNGPPTPQEYVCLLLGLLNPEGYDYDLDVLGSLLDVSKFQCELATASYDLSLYKPSHVALAAILNSLDGVEEDLLSCMGRYGFLKRMCQLMQFVDMKDVAYVQVQLRVLFCHSSIVDNNRDPPRQERHHDQDAVSCQDCIPGSSDNSDTEALIKRKDLKREHLQTSREFKCTSPVSVS